MPEEAQGAKPVLVVFARNPEPGKVKTRLTRDVGAQAAARVYQALAESVWKKTRGGEYARWLYVTPPHAEGALRKWLPGADRYLAQPKSEDLGERLAHAFGHAFRSDARKVAVVGTDVPALTSDLVAEAFTALDTHTAVLGPSEDGGFWLLGLKAPGVVGFEGIEWGTSTAGRGMLTNLRASGHAIAILPTLADLDTAEDLIAFPEFAALAQPDMEGP